MTQPFSLKTGDTIGIISTARKISKEELSYSIELFESWGLKVVLGKTIGAEENQFAGSDALRLQDIQSMLDEKSIKAIVCARGGYGSIRIIDQINFARFVLNPKWIIGYSDISILHAHINNYLNIQTLHASMPINFESNTSQALESLKNALFGCEISYNFPSHKKNKIGQTSAPIIGGNLSILYSLLGTSSGFNPDHKILYIEDLDEMLYHVDRMIIALKRAGKFNNLKALLVGDMSQMRDNTKAFGFAKDNPFGKSAIDIILEHTTEFDFPICFDIPSGHIKDNKSLIFGRNVNLEINSEQSSLKFT